MTDGAAFTPAPTTLGWEPVWIAYGRGGLEVLLPPDATVLAPVERPGLADAHDDILARVTSAIAPLLPLAHGPIALVFPDLTRPFPHKVVLPA